MKTHNLTQGSQEWHAYRANHFNASDAPAMMGASPHNKRSDLLKQMASGLAEEVDAGKQVLFDNGHRFEKLSRPLAEDLVGENLYPVTGSLDRLSASFDGITMDGMTVWEHKTLNKDIRAAESAAHLGLHLRIQMEQQLLVAGAKRCLFLATKWDNNDQLVEEKHFWYESDAKLRADIEAGWAQFAADLATYAPRALPPKAVAEAIMQLPALSIQIRGEVAVSNLPAFQEKAEAFIANIKTDLVTDDDFANAEATIKFCSDAEDSLEQAKAAAIAQTADIDELMRTVDHIKAQLREKRLILTNTVKDKKELLKASILNKAKTEFAEYVAALELEIAPLRLVYQARDFAGAMKNKRTLKTLHDAVDTEMAAAKIAIDALAKGVRGRFNWYLNTAAGHESLFADLQTIIQKPDDDFKLLVKTRIDAELARRQAAADAERERIASEERAKLLAEQAAQPIAAFDASTTGDSANSIEERPLGVLAPAASWPFPVSHKPAAAPASAPTLRMGQINERLAPIAVTVEGLRKLGVEPAERGSAAVLYYEHDFEKICLALFQHINSVRAKQLQAA
jgi:putative phage-type endonuclease